MPHENEIARIVVDACYGIHREMGPGLLESVYERILAAELHNRGVSAQRQVAVPVVWHGVTLEDGFRADLIVEKKVIVELKSIESLAPVHFKQLLTYLRLANLRLGLLVNFGAPTMKEGLRRMVNNLEE